VRSIKRLLLLLSVAQALLPVAFAQDAINIATRTRGNLPASRLNAPGIAGLCLQTDGSGGVMLATCTAGGGGSGSVTTFSAGNLSPLFTASVTNASSTPSLAFTLSNITGHKFLGNNTSGTVAPSFIQPATTDLADFSPTAPTTSGKIPIWDSGSSTYIPGDPLVQGLLPDGSTTAGNPVAIGGYDTAGTPALHRSTFINGTPGGTEYGLITRNIPSGTQPVSGTVAVSNFPATQPVSIAASVTVAQATGTNLHTVVDSAPTTAVTASTLPLPTGAATAAKQPALGTAGTPSADVITVQGSASGTALKTDGSAVTQPVSVASSVTVAQATGTNLHTVVDSAPTTAVTLATVPLPTGAATSANQSTVKAASTAATSTDTSQVVQLSPNQPSLTTPLNVKGAQTNNNAAPSSDNIGTLPAVANAAPQSLTEGNAVKIRTDLSGNLIVNEHPPTVLGCYTVNGRTGTYTGLASGAILVSYRWTSSASFAVIQRVKVNVITSTAATTAGEAERELHVVRSFTVSDTGGTAITMSGNNAKMRTSQATSAVGDFRFGQPLTAGTGTADANPVSSAVAWLPLNFTGVDIGCGGAGPTGAVWSCAGGVGPVDLLNATNGQEYPLVLAQNEGWRITIGKDAMPAAAVQQTTFTAEWCEVSNY
jgi:hypothetical protein